MKRWMILLLCILCMACRTTESAPLPSPAPTAAATASPAPAVDWDALLRARTVSIALPDAVETVSLHRLGVRVNDGKLELSPERARAYADALCAAYRTEPSDAEVFFTGEIDEPFAYTPARAGSEPDAEALAALFRSLDFSKQEQTVSAPMRVVAADVTEQVLMRDHALLSEYTTSFSGNTLGKANRVHNIVLAASRIHGATVAAGEVFSINRAILNRTKANGYLLAGAIANGMNTTEYGGGVCQVSTTLFNAVMMADLEVVERYHHSWPMQYAPVGRDATIATGIKDFRFRNTSDAPVTIVAFTDEREKTVTVRLYGRHSDAFDHIEIVSEQLSRLPSKPAELHLDESLPANTKEVERQGRRGRTSVTYKDYYDEAGNLLRRVTAFEDVYPSIGEIAYVSADLYH